MNMRISGKGSIPAGEYEKISVSGSGRLFGTILCASLTSSGTLNGESIKCQGVIKSAGTTRFSGNIYTEALKASGSFSCDGNIEAEENISISGSARCGGNIKCESLYFS